MKHQNSSKIFHKNKINTKQKNSIQIINQKESYKKDFSKINDILNHPMLKRRLPPLEKSFQEKRDNEKFDDEINNSKNLREQINYNIEKLKKSEIKKQKEEKEEKKEKEEIKDSLELNKEEFNYKILEKFINKKEKIEENNKVNYEKKIIKEFLIKNDMGAGTPSFPDNIQDLKNEINNKTKLILKLSDEQNECKEKLNSLLCKLNIYLVENSDFLKKEDAEFFLTEGREEYLLELKKKLDQLKKDITTIKNNKKMLKQQYDILNNKDKNLNSDNIQRKIDKIKTENDELLKQITLTKTKSRLKGKKFKNFGKNAKYLTDIDQIMNELKTLESKKHEYYKRYSGNYKLIDTCIKEFENLEKNYLNEKENNNYFNAKIEEEINRLREDLTPNKEEILKRIENDTSFIIRKLLHNEKIRENIFRTPIPYKPDDAQKMKMKRKNSLGSFAKSGKLNLSKRKNFSGKNRKINIYAKDTKEKNSQINKENTDIEINKTNYDEISDFEFREMLNKKEYCYDILTKLEKSIKEAQKMYQRKIKDINLDVEKSQNKLNAKQNENNLLQIEIDNLSKLLTITEKENLLIYEQNNNKNLKNNNKNKSKTEEEHELQSQKEYLSPENYPIHNDNLINQKSTKEKELIPSNINTDTTRNEILTDLKAINPQNLDDQIQDSETMRKNNLSKTNNNIVMKFPDLSNIEENVNDNLNNEEQRNKIIEDIKKKYNINFNEMNEDFSLGENQEENKIKNKFYYEHENALNEKIDEKYESDIYNNKEDDLKYEYKDINNDNENINDNNNENGENKEIYNEQEYILEENNNEDSLEQIQNQNEN